MKVGRKNKNFFIPNSPDREMENSSKKENKISFSKSKVEKDFLPSKINSSGLPNFFSRPIFLIFFLILIVGFIFFLVSNFMEEKNPNFLTCGDGTFSGYCSLKKPFFCSNETLVENIFLCGCPKSADFQNGSCISKYNSSIENKSLEYNLYGVKGNLSFEFRQDVLDELLELPRYQIYSQNEIPRRDDFAFKKINNDLQREFLIPLLIQIENLSPKSKDIQAKIAISLVQNLPYNESQFISFFGKEVRVSRYPYQVLVEGQGGCEGKSELLAFFLKEIGFGVVLFYYPEENHEVVGIKCPIEKSFRGTGYCFIETTTPSPISFSEGRYLSTEGIGKLESEPQIIMISDGISLIQNLDDYSDSRALGKIIESIENNGELNYFQKKKMDSLRERYSLNY
ncbi:hypothetical protein COU58_01635 [Candidatus Pacearchaeota archaeon CG10_big_fil_rev_8_21_14_0_10_32_42]|nr:MAG: hypothetical protein COU58_01635 [Candidatus Pacearchaeota archaeon CG10_big_fil_rev_8_21_14_0_10_32_42]